MICKPGSVLTIIRLAKSLLIRSSNLPYDSRTRTPVYTNQLISVAVCLRLVLLPIGLVMPRNLSAHAVSSYLTFSPSPMSENRQRQIIFCDAFHRVTPPGRYPVLCPCEARTFLQPRRVSDCPTI